jgi:hypothetical protein
VRADAGGAQRIDPRGDDEGGVMQRIAVIAKLRPGVTDEAARLIEAGPPFDPSKHDVERHTVFLAPDVVIFVFEGGHVNSLLSALGGPDEQAALGAWEPLLDGTPLIAQQAYDWISPARLSVNHWGE